MAADELGLPLSGYSTSAERNPVLRKKSSFGKPSARRYFGGEPNQLAQAE
jgi:hypothetical protein